MTRSPPGGSPLWIVLWGGAGVLLILALGWFFWSRGVEATKTVASEVEIAPPRIAPPNLPPPKLPDLPIPKPQ